MTDELLYTPLLINIFINSSCKITSKFHHTSSRKVQKQEIYYMYNSDSKIRSIIPITEQIENYDSYSLPSLRETSVWRLLEISKNE